MANAAEKPTSIWSAPFVMLIVVSFVHTMGTFTGMTVLPLYVRELGASASLIGFITGAFAITALAVRPFSGPAFDSFSKKKLYAAAIVLCAIATYGYGLTSSLGVIVAMRFINGIGIGCAGPLGMALASEYLPQERLSSGIGFFTVATAMSQAIGPAFGIEMSRLVGFRPTFLVSGVFLTVGVLMLVLVREMPPASPRPPYQIRLNRIFAKQAIPPAIVLCLLSMSFACVGSFIAIYGGLRGVGQIGLYFTVYALCLLFTRPGFGKLSDRFGTTKVAVPAICCFGLSFVIISQAQSLPAFIAAALVAGCGFGATTPLMQALVFKCVPRMYRGAGSNTTYTGQDLGQLVGAYMGGFIIDSVAASTGSEVAGYSTMWLVMLVPIALGLLVYLGMRGRIARYQAENDAREAQARTQADEG